MVVKPRAARVMMPCGLVWYAAKRPTIRLPLARARTISSPDTIANGTVPAPSMSTVGAEAPPGRISTAEPVLGVCARHLRGVEAAELRLRLPVELELDRGRSGAARGVAARTRAFGRRRIAAAARDGGHAAEHERRARRESSGRESSVSA